ncbi:pseudouridylate synthase RPUSD4, mitochondrial-like [Glandiceps talaboti]
MGMNTRSEDDYFGIDQEGNFDKFDTTLDTTFSIQEKTVDTQQRRKRKKTQSSTSRNIREKYVPGEDDIVVGETQDNSESQSVQNDEVSSSKMSTAKKSAMKIRQQLYHERSQSSRREHTRVNTEEEKRNQTELPRGRTDSHGYQVLSYQVKDLSRLSTQVVAKILHDSIIYDHDDVIAIDKPYGLPSHGGPGVTNNVNDTLPLLARLIDKSLTKLYLIHRLDKETTGVMLLARSEVTARQLNAMFRHHQVVKKYWVLTIHVPEPNEGVIEIPMAEGEVAGKRRMLLRPEYGLVYKDFAKLPRSRGTAAITNYRVLSTSGNCALVELQPETGIKHQIRCHLATGLGCPILGDHKYSHSDRLAPQKVPGDMLQKLDMRQSKARTIPMHLHAKQLIIPEFRDGRNLFISAKPPKHFTRNMRKLKIESP